MSSEGVVHLIDDDDGMRASLVFMLETAGFQPHAYASADAFLEAAAGASGCVVTDVRMPGMNGIELIEAMNTRGVDLPVVVITGHADVAMAVEAMKLGARDFLEKPFQEEALLGAVRACLDTRVDPERERSQQIVASLSPRERDVLKGLVDGGSNKSIALDLGISPRTVEIYRANLMIKTGAAGLADLVRLGIAADIG